MLARTIYEILEYTVESAPTKKIPGSPTCFLGRISRYAPVDWSSSSV